jgi:hypothetical protein
VLVERVCLEVFDLQSSQRGEEVIAMIGLLLIAALLVFDALVYRRIGNPYR